MESIKRSVFGAKNWPFLRKFSVGLMIGVAIGWVLWQQMQSEDGEQFRLTSLKTAEIDITEPRLSDQRQVSKGTETSRDNLKIPTSSPKVARGDDLKAIHGIGPVFARRLNEAGIKTYADLAAQEPQRLLEIVQAKAWQALDPKAWIDEAGSLASE